MRAISLFSGCGGLDFGACRAGADVVLATDVMPEAAQTHRRWFSSDFVQADIREVSRFPEADLVVGGYPCQSFSMGGNRAPGTDQRTYLFREFARVVAAVQPRFFVAENVSGLKSLEQGRWLAEQVRVFGEAGSHGYEVTHELLKAEDYGVPQRRRRLFIVGVRKDLGLRYRFPAPTHFPPEVASRTGRPAHASHGDAIRHLPLWPAGEFYERPHDPEGHFSWYYMSRNRKADWDAPSFTVVANFRHTTLHPASQRMHLLWSDLKNGFKQRWEFRGDYEHLDADPSRPVLEVPRRLSWRECAAIQTFPEGFEPAGNLARKFEQIGNAVPPGLATAVIGPLVDGSGLVDMTRGATVSAPETPSVRG